MIDVVDKGDFLVFKMDNKHVVIYVKTGKAVAWQFNSYWPLLGAIERG